jgi:hypothetical protein
METQEAKERMGGGSSPFRLFRCGAGCFHLVWRHNLVVHFTPCQLQKLLECLEQLLEGWPAESIGRSWFGGYRDGSGFYNLPLFQDAIVLRLRETEAQPLRQALAAACQDLNAEQEARVAHSRVM